MKAEGLLPTFLKLDNTSLRKLRTQALTDAGIQDWMIAETIGQKDKNFQNLGYYRKMDHDDKIKMAHVLANPWKCQKKLLSMKSICLKVLTKKIFLLYHS